jgi:hypothetical protein
VAIYPLLTSSLHASGLVYQFLYAVGKSKHHDPWNHVFGLFLTLLTSEDVAGQFQEQTDD